MKKIEKQLKIESKALLPDDKLKNRIAEEAFGGNVRAVKPAAAVKKHKKAFVAALAAVIVVVICVPLLAVFLKTGGGTVDPTIPVIPPETKEIYAFGAYSCGLLLAGADTGGAAASSSDGEENGGQPDTQSPVVTPEKIEFLGESMLMIENIMASSSVTTDTESDRADYMRKMTVTVTDLSNVTHSYVIYYNETASEESDGEIESTISGILVLNGQDYSVSGKREKDLEDNEYEIKMTVKFGENERVEFEQEIEEKNGVKEFSYKYTLYENGRKVKSFELERETAADGETEVEMEIIKDNGEKTKIEYEFSDKQSAEISIVIKFPDNTSAEIEVKCESDRYVFTYNGEETIYYKPGGN